jgi:hypothetical protein
MSGCVAIAMTMALAGGCASQPSSNRTETSAATVRAAQEVGADRVPAANLHLQYAKEQMEHARRLEELGGDVNYADAQLLLMRAQADADMALALAREDQDRQAAQQALDRARSAQQP